MVLWIRRAAQLAACLALVVSARAEDAPIMLPPLEVVADATKEVKPWDYAAYPGGEVLSRTSRIVTREFIAGQHRLQQVISLILPETLQGRRSVPDLLILTTPTEGASLSKDLVARAVADSAAGRAARADDGNGPRIRVFDNLRLNDADATAVYAVVDEFAFSSTTMQFTSDQLRFLMETRVPRLPDWFMVGMQVLYGQAEIKDDTVVFGRANWTPAEVGYRFLRDPDLASPLLPMADLFEKPCPPLAGATLVAAQTWRSQAALLVRWMIENESRRTRLWRLAARAAEVPLNDELCQQLIGMDYIELRDRLEDYLRTALVRDGFKLKVSKLTPAPPVEIRPVQPAETARIKGDWERLATNWVRSRQPQYINQYELQTRRTLTPNPAEAARDPRLLAVQGLYEVDLGYDAAALPLLEAAAAAKVTRPRVYFELARLRYATALKDPKGGNGLLNSEQVNAVLEPFKTGFQQEPLLLESCRLISEAWSRSTATLGPAQFALCDRALRAYPHDPVLLYNIGAIRALHGQAAEATTLLQRGLALADTPAFKARFEKMLTSLKSPAP